MRPAPRFPRLILALCVAGALFAASTPGLADSSRQPAIIEAHAEGAMLRIVGIDLAGGTPKLTLGSVALSIVSATATRIDALLPVGVAPGSYLLTLTLAKGRKDAVADRSEDSKYDEFWITIGGGGAAGKDGKDGVAGPQGPTGLAGKDGATGPAGKDGAQGPAGKEGATGPAGRDGEPGPRGKDGGVGPTGPSGPPGAGGSLATIESLGGLPCTVAMCQGTTAVSFDPVTSTARLSCVRVAGNYTVRIQGTTAVRAVMFNPDDALRFTSDVPGYSGDTSINIGTQRGGGALPFDVVAAGNLCAGQVVNVTVTRTGSTVASRALHVQGGSCVNVDFWNVQRSYAPLSVTCTFTMNSDQIITIQP